ncbi:MAG: hypothetical protein PHV34_11870 [Verrucomicrobiae bacterium]|nr:hypothetical protein [Verrucomicrobiae bacterium]
MTTHDYFQGVSDGISGNPYNRNDSCGAYARGFKKGRHALRLKTSAKRRLKRSVWGQQEFSREASWEPAFQTI